MTKGEEALKRLCSCVPGGDMYPSCWAEDLEVPELVAERDCFRAVYNRLYQHRDARIATRHGLFRLQVRESIAAL